MKQTHTNMGVTSGEWDAFMENFVATLDAFNVGKAEQDELLNNLRPMRADIVEVDSPQGRNTAAVRVHTSTAAVS